jgi:hypothetical protein
VHRIPTLALVGAYLAAIVAANLLVAHDPSWVYVNGFLFIGLDLTTRDVLHDRWGKLAASRTSRSWLSPAQSSATY